VCTKRRLTSALGSLNRSAESFLRGKVGDIHGKAYGCLGQMLSSLGRPLAIDGVFLRLGGRHVLVIAMVMMFVMMMHLGSLRGWRAVVAVRGTSNI